MPTGKLYTWLLVTLDQIKKPKNIFVCNCFFTLYFRRFHVPMTNIACPRDFVCCASELGRFKDIGVMEVLQLLLLWIVANNKNKETFVR